MDGDSGLGARRYSRQERVWRRYEGVRIHVDQDGRGSAVEDDLGCRCEGPSREDDFVTRSDAKRIQCQVQRSRCRIQGDRVSDTNLRREGGLEFIGARTGREPTRREDLECGLLLEVGDRRAGEGEKVAINRHGKQGATGLVA
jgi:hypothetical protein